MGRFALYANSATGESGLRITKADDVDPWTIPVTDAGKFIFDGLNPKQIFPLAFAELDFSTDFNPLPGGESTVFFPNGSTATTASWMITRIEVGNNYIVRYRFRNLYQNVYSVDIPFISYARIRDASDYVYSHYSDERYVFRPGEYLEGYLENVIGLGQVLDITENGFSGFHLYYEWTSQDGSGSTPSFPLVETITWPLPADSRSDGFDAGPATPGTKPVSLTSDGIKIARSGFDVNSGEDNQIVSATKSPLLVVKTGVLNFTGNGTINVALPTWFDYTGVELFCDTIVSNAGADFYYPAQYVGAVPDYPQWNHRVLTKITGSTLEVVNQSGRAIEVRYIVFRNPGVYTPPPDGHASLPSNVVGGVFQYEGDQNTPAYVQMRRPTNADPISLNDVIIDTRLPTAPIIAEGNWVIPQGGNVASPVAAETHTVSFANPDDDFVAYPVFMMKRDVDRWTPPGVRLLLGRSQDGSYHPFHGQFARDTAMARVRSTEVTFFAYPRHPNDMAANNGGGSWVVNPVYYNLSDALELRYYIFAIPK